MVVLASCVFCGHNLLSGEYDRWGNVMYITLVRPSWAIALSWVIFACIFGYGGPVDWFLSLPIFQVLSRFSYSLYLLHAPILMAIVASMKAPEYFTNFKMVCNIYFLFLASFVSVQFLMHVLLVL